jgi:hypothetical protein
MIAADLCATVLDITHLPLPSASVNVESLATGKAYLARADQRGTACLSVPEGLYSVEASLTGFLHVKYYPVRATAEAKQNLIFWLPLGEIREGPFGGDSTLSGTMLSRGAPIESADVCVIGPGGAPRTCTVTNDLGEYALVVPPGAYETEIRTRDGHVYRSRVDISTPGVYRNRLSLSAGMAKP